MIKRIIFSALILFPLFINYSAVSTHSQKQRINEKNKFEAVESVINASIADSAFPGAVILIRKGWEDSLRKSFRLLYL